MISEKPMIAVQGRPQFVTDVGQEVGLGPAGQFRLFLGTAQLTLGAVTAGHIVIGRQGAAAGHRAMQHVDYPAVGQEVLQLGLPGRWPQQPSGAAA